MAKFCKPKTTVIATTKHMKGKFRKDVMKNHRRNKKNFMKSGKMKVTEK